MKKKSILSAIILCSVLTTQLYPSQSDTSSNLSDYSDGDYSDGDYSEFDQYNDDSGFPQAEICEHYNDIIDNPQATSFELAAALQHNLEVHDNADAVLRILSHPQASGIGVNVLIFQIKLCAFYDMNIAVKAIIDQTKNASAQAHMISSALEGAVMGENDNLVKHIITTYKPNPTIKKAALQVAQELQDEEALSILQGGTLTKAGKSINRVMRIPGLGGTK